MDIDFFKEGRHWYVAVGCNLLGPFDSLGETEQAAVTALEIRWREMVDKE